MTQTMGFDEAMSQRILATYQTPDVVEQRRLVRLAVDAQPGEDVLDLGSGPGLLAVELAAEVGPTGSVVGIDPSDAMLAIARTQQPGDGAAPLRFLEGDATRIPVPDASSDVCVSTQVLEYVADIPGALAEVRRVLRPGGRLVVVDTDWESIVWHTDDPELMDRVLSAWDEHLVDPYLPRTLTPQLRQAGFTVVWRSTIPMFNAGYSADTYSAGLMGFITSFVPGHSGLDAADLDRWAAGLIALGDDYFFSVNRYLFVATV